MNYYIQGDAANADKIKAAFESKGFNTMSWVFDSSDYLYFNIGSEVYTIDYKIKHIITGRHDYTPLELPVEPKPHYDIANFKVGMPVLVRDNDGRWTYVLFSHSYVGSDGKTHFNACGWTWSQCIPYNDDTKHLLVTTDMCPEEYVNW